MVLDLGHRKESYKILRKWVKIVSKITLFICLFNNIKESEKAGKNRKKIAPAAPKIFPCGEGNSHIFLRGGEKNSTFSKNMLPC